MQVLGDVEGLQQACEFRFLRRTLRGRGISSTYLINSLV
jgi:hypothetical protein